MDFKSDISGLIPVIGKVVEAGAYNVKSNVVGFHKGELRVVISHNRMLVYGTDDEGEIKALVEWMIQKISDARKAG